MTETNQYTNLLPDLLNHHYFEFVQPSQVTYLDTGIDSHVFCIERKTGVKETIKVYYQESLTVDAIDKYQLLTNQLAQIEPFTTTLILDKERWEAKFPIVPISYVGHLSNGMAFSASPFIAGQHLEDITTQIFSEGIDINGGEIASKSIEVLSSDGRSFVPFPKDTLKEIFKRGFWIANRTKRLEHYFNDFMNGILKTKNIGIHPKNIKFIVDEQSRILLFIVTDIEGVLFECPDIISNN